MVLEWLKVGVFKSWSKAGEVELGDVVDGCQFDSETDRVDL